MTLLDESLVDTDLDISAIHDVQDQLRLFKDRCCVGDVFFGVLLSSLGEVYGLVLHRDQTVICHLEDIYGSLGLFGQSRLELLEHLLLEGEHVGQYVLLWVF